MSQRKPIAIMLIVTLVMQILLPILSVVFESGITVKSIAATELTSGDWKYTINDDGETITITDYIGSLTELTIPKMIDKYNVTRIGKLAFFCCSNLKCIVIPDSVKSIEDSAFKFCYSLTSITIPDSVTSIGNYAFDECSSLTNLTIPNSVTRIGDSAFRECTSLTNIIIPNSVTHIGSNAFYNCTSLTSVTISKGVISIGSYAFNGCNNLKNINVDEENEYYSSKNGVLYNKDQTERIYPKEITSGDWKYEFNEDESSIIITKYNGTDLKVIVPSKIDNYNVEGVGKSYFLDSSLYNSVFTGNTTVTEVTISDGIKYIGNSAFRNCTSLKNISIPNSLENIGSYAFYGCENLYNIVLPNNLTTIERGIFKECTNLTSVTIPEGVTYIKMLAFENCNISSIILPESLLKIDDNAFNGCALETITIPSNVKFVSYASTDLFTNCSKLTSINVSQDNPNYCSENGVLFNKNKTELIAYPIGNKQSKYTIPKGVENIADYAFYGCNNISSITIPDSVKDIADYAFYGCSNISNIIIPDNVESMGRDVFANCTNLESVEISDQVKELMYNAFWGCSKLINVKLGKDTKIIYDNAFRECSNLTTINLPESIEEIKFQAFCDTKLKNIDIPQNVKNIENNVFNGCNDLENIIVDSTNQNYCSENGVLFNKEKTILMKYPDNKQDIIYETPLTVETIEEGAFNQCKNLEIIKLSDSVVNIEDWAFANSSIKDFKIPKNCGDVLGMRTFSGSKIENVITYKTLNESLINRINFSTPFDEVFPYTLWGLKNSHAEQYAEENNIEFNYLELQSIKVSKAPLKTQYAIGETFCPEGMVVTATFMYDTNKTVEYDIDETDYIISSNEELTTENNKITISYTEDGITKTTTQAIVVAGKELTGIAVTTAPSKTEYIAGQCFEAEGMVVTASYDDGTTKEVTNYIITDGRSLTAGKTSVTISYTENGVTKTTIQPITVAAKVLTGITVTTSPSNTTYIEGQSFNTAGMIVTATYNDGTAKEVTNYTVIDANNLTAGKTSVTISYTEDGTTKTTTQAITVHAKKLTEITVTTPPNNTTYVAGQSFDTTGMVVTASYNDGTTKEVINYTVTDGDNLTAGKTSVTISYTEDGITKTTTQDITVSEKLEIDLGTYEEQQEENAKYITKITPETTIGDFIENINTNGTVEVYKGTEKITNTETNIGTGMTMRITLNQEQLKYTIVIKGDINGDGNAKLSDLSKLKLSVIGITQLEGAYKKAADINGDGNVKLSDLSKMKLYLVGKSSL